MRGAGGWAEMVRLRGGMSHVKEDMLQTVGTALRRLGVSHLDARATDGGGGGANGG